ncbi:MAG: hypothetical protein RJA70_818 [Pseudomonadota bacterium]|jgi:CRP-like cAMP-binding protein/Fe-S-cluster-containing dehydrogenase component
MNEAWIPTGDPIAEKALADVTACIGCNDCMIACPLPQSRWISIAALNAAVDEPVIYDPQVIDFVTACTQCGQCVSACPADLSRADMVLFNKTKVEDTVPDHLLSVQVGSNVQLSGLTLDALCRQMATVPLFRGVNFQDMRRLLLTVTLRQLEGGELVCEGGEYHERLVVVLAGALEQYSLDDNGRRVVIVSYGSGSFLGEMGVLADQPEPFSVASPHVSLIIEIPKASLKRLMRRSPEFDATMTELYRRRALWTYARTPEVLGGLPEAAITELFADAELTLLQPGDWVFGEGTEPSHVYLVRSGFLRASRKLAEGERVLTYFREGEAFGIIAVLRFEASHCYSVQAATRAEVICVPAARFHAVLHRYPNAASALAQGAVQAERVARSPELNPAPSQQASQLGTHAMPLTPEVLLDMGVADGREVLVIDQTKCTYCQNCIEACARRHGHSRLKLQGLQLEHLLFPTACRHCEDPQCLLCSVNGIVRRTSGEISIVEDNCIGCGACAERCPYGNISLHPVDPPKKSLVFSLLDLLRGPRDRASAFSLLAPELPKRAVKCDLCADYTDYACVTACPTGAAFRTDPSQTLGGPDSLFSRVRAL